MLRSVARYERRLARLGRAHPSVIWQHFDATVLRASRIAYLYGCGSRDGGPNFRYPRHYVVVRAQGRVVYLLRTDDGGQYGALVATTTCALPR